MAALNKTRQEMIHVLELKRAEQQACFDFAVHLSGCAICRSGVGTTAADLCAAGLEARGKLIATGRACDEVDQERARKNAALMGVSP